MGAGQLQMSDSLKIAEDGTCICNEIVIAEHNIDVLEVGRWYNHF